MTKSPSANEEVILAELCNISARQQAAGEIFAAEYVVAASWPSDAILHSYFEWDDKVAAEQWRRHQADELISKVEIVDPKRGIKFPVFVRDPR